MGGASGTAELFMSLTGDSNILWCRASIVFFFDSTSIIYFRKNFFSSIFEIKYEKCINIYCQVKKK